MIYNKALTGLFLCQLKHNVKVFLTRSSFSGVLLMKKIILLRHGNAADYWSDFERPLSTKGKEEVRRVSSQILDHANPIPQCVICSEATRTKETLEIFTEMCPGESFETVYVPTLYHGTFGDVLKCISQTQNAIETLMLVGHNPVLSELASTLSQTYTQLETANAAILTGMTQNWKHITSQEWKLETVYKPI